MTDPAVPAGRSQSKRLVSIDTLRGVAALAVVGHHAVTFAVLPAAILGFQFALFSVFNVGYLGVPLFFVISGFCIHLSWASKYTVDPKYKLEYFSFWKRRLRRLYIPYFIALCLCMALVVAAYVRGLDVPLVQNYPEPRSRWMAADFLAHVTMLHGLHPVFDKAGGNGPFWTLAREEYFYILYLPLLACRRRYGLWPVILAVLMLSLAVPILFKPIVPPLSPWWSVITTSAFVLWIQWCLGMVAVEAWLGIIKLPRWTGSILLVPVWWICATLADRYYPLLSPFIWGMVFFTMVLFCVDREQRGAWPRHVVVRNLAIVGTFSYSLYLVHNPIRSVVKIILSPLHLGTTPASYWLMVSIIIAAGVVGGRVYYWAVERHFLSRPGSRLQHTRAVVA